MKLDEILSYIFNIATFLLGLFIAWQLIRYTNISWDSFDNCMKAKCGTNITIVCEACDKYKALHENWTNKLGMAFSVIVAYAFVVNGIKVFKA